MPLNQDKPDWPWYLAAPDRVIARYLGRTVRGEIARKGNMPDTWFIILDGSNRRVQVECADCLDEQAEITAGRAKRCEYTPGR